jgi:hypothetical protein
MAYVIPNVTVAKVWRERGLQPWRAGSFKFCADPEPETRVRGVTGLYLNPPAWRSCCAWARSPGPRRWNGPRRCCQPAQVSHIADAIMGQIFPYAQITASLPWPTVLAPIASADAVPGMNSMPPGTTAGIAARVHIPVADRCTI